MARKKSKKAKQTKKSASGRLRPEEKKLNDLRAIIEKQPDNLATRLQLAELYHKTSQSEKLVELLESIEAQYPFANKYLNGQYDRLLAFGYAHLKKLVPAEKILERALADNPDAIDLWFTKTYVDYSLGDFDKSIGSGERYLTLHAKLDNTKNEENKIPRSCHTNTHLARLLNFLGCAERDRLKPQQAITRYKQGLEIDHVNHLLYTNLAALHMSIDDREAAQKVVTKGLESCSQVQELRLLAQTLKRDFTISACLMVKNEEELLPQCLESVRSWVDEIIVVDTGSTDRTIEIAQSYGARIFHQPWEGSFSKHRNYTIEKATSDWVLIIDADEEMVVEDVPRLLGLLGEKIASIVSISVINVYGEDKRRTVFLPSVRLFKRDLGIHYDGIVHNQIQIPEKVPTLRADVRLRHYGYDLSEEKMRQKANRSRALLEKQLAENPDNAMAMFNLGQLIRTGPDETVIERSKEVIGYASRAIELTDPKNRKERHIHLMCLDQLAWSHFYLKEYEQALEYCREALKHKPDYLDPLILRGHIYLDMNRIEEAENHFNDYLKAVAAYEMTRETENLIINHVDSKIVACYALACAAMLKGDSSAAKTRFAEVLTIDEKYLEANALMGQLHLRTNQLDEAHKYLARQIDIGNSSMDTLLWMGDLWVRRNDHVKAEDCYIRAIAESDHSIRAISRLVQLYLSSQKADKLNQLISDHRATFIADPATSSKLAAKAFEADFHASAIEIYQTIIDGGETNPEIYNDLANCHFRLRDYSDAEKYYKLAIDSSSPPVVAYRNLGLTLVALNRPKEALTALDQYLKYGPEDVELLQVAGDIAVSLKNFPAATGYYERYLGQLAQVEPDSSEGIPSGVVKALCRLSDCYLYMGHRDSAAMGYQRVLAMIPDYEPAKLGLAELEKVASGA